MDKWLTYSPVSGHGNATITLSASTLTGLEDRIATLIATGSQEGQTLSATTVITQKYLTLTEIYFENLTWSTDVAWSGGTATSASCSFTIIAKYSDNSTEDITNLANVTGSLFVPVTTATTRQSVGTLTLTATYEDKTCTGSVEVYQEAPSLSEIFFSALNWVTDVAWSGGTATKDNCSYTIFAKYSNNVQVDVTSEATISGSLAVPISTKLTRQVVGTLSLTAEYQGKTCNGSVTAYQEAPSLSEIFFNNLEWVTDIPASGGTATKNNCNYSVYAKYSNNIQVDVTSEANVSGSLQVSPNYVVERHSVGNLALTASYEDKTCTGSVEVYQELQQQEISAIAFNSLTWVTNVAASGGTATKDNCTYQIDLILNNGIVISDITSLCTVSGSIVVEPHYELQPNQDGLLTLQGEYRGFTCNGSVNAYRDALTINDIVNIDLSGLTWNGSDIDCTGGTVDYTNCDYDVNLNIVDGSVINITDIANVSGSTWIPFSNIMERHTGGTLTVTAEFSGFTDSDGVAIWQEAYDYYKDWFTIENTGSTDSSFSVKVSSYYYIYYSYDYGKTWSEGGETVSGSIPANSCVKFKSSANSNSFRGQLDNCIVYGNAMSLVGQDNYRNKYDFTGNKRLEYLFNECNITNAENLILQATGTTEYCYSHMFYNCTELIKPPKRIANAEAHNYTYQSMFQGCTSLISAPTTSISQLKRYSCHRMFYNCSSLVSADNIQLGEIYQAALESIYCCGSMFEGCTSLTNAPSILPARMLTQRCYENMFKGCASLTSAPELPATTLGDECYRMMFYGCSNLRYITCLANTINSPSFQTSLWVYGVAPTGTFAKNPNMNSWTTGDDGIPTGWTVINYGLTGISISNLTWVADIPLSGGTADKNNCSYSVHANYNDGTVIDITNQATVSGSLNVPATTATTRQNVGTLTLTAQYSGFTTTGDVIAYQEGVGVTGISFENLTWVTDIPSSGGTGDSANCSYSIYANYNDGTSVDVTSISTVSGSLTVPSTIINERQNVGTLTLTAQYSGFTTTGDVIAYQEASPIPTSSAPLTFKIISGGTIVWKSVAGYMAKTISYSKDNGDTWTSITATKNGTNISVNTGDVIIFKGDNSRYASGTEYYNTFKTTDGTLFSVQGNIMSLIDSAGFVTAKALTDSYTFYRLFYNCSGLVSAEHLILPATNLANNCYQEMFQNCTSLTTAPALPAITLKDRCYYYMFRDCTSLTTAPALPATTLAGSCYGSMFRNCTSLTNAPALPATTLASYCYSYMFSDCTSLAIAPVLPATTLDEGCYESMFDGCTSLASVPANYLPATTLKDRCYYGMFYGCTSLTIAPALPATTLANYCYDSMFQGCASLTTAPELPATTLNLMCYSSMFRNCKKLNYIKCLATDISAKSCTISWVDGVASTGTFVKASSMTSWKTGTDGNGIPEGWTVINAS